MYLEYNLHKVRNSDGVPCQVAWLSALSLALWVAAALSKSAARGWELNGISWESGGVLYCSNRQSVKKGKKEGTDFHLLPYVIFFGTTVLKRKGGERLMYESNYQCVLGSTHTHTQTCAYAQTEHGRVIWLPQCTADTTVHQRHGGRARRSPPAE